MAECSKRLKILSGDMVSEFNEKISWASGDRSFPCDYLEQKFLSANNLLWFMQPQGFDINSAWHWRPYNLLTPFTIIPTGTRDICDINGKGYVVLGGVTATSPLITAHIELETADGDVFIEEFSCATLLVANLILPMPSGWWVSQVAPLTPAYSIMFTPATWWPFSKRLLVQLRNPTPAPIICVSSVLAIIDQENAKHKP